MNDSRPRPAKGGEKGKTMKEAFDIPCIMDSLRAEVDAGTMTIEQAAQELYRAGWSNFVDVEKARALLRQAGAGKP